MSCGNKLNRQTIHLPRISSNFFPPDGLGKEIFKGGKRVAKLQNFD